MNKYKLIVDSSCDLPMEFMEKYNIGCTDLIVNFNDKSYRDRIDITSKEIMEMYDKTKIVPKTSALNIPTLVEVFEEALKEYDHIFYMPISSYISSINNNAHLAAREMDAEDKITVLDSLSLSSGSALEAIGISEDILAGLSPEEIEKRHNERLKKVQMSFVIDTMEFLYKGGRCSGLTYLVGSKILHLHPLVRLDNGKMSVHKLVRGGNIAKGIDAQFEEFKANHEKGNIDLSYPIFLPHVEGDKYLKELVKMLTKLVGPNILYPIEASGIITCHCSRNTVGLAYMLKEDLLAK